MSNFEHNKAYEKAPEEVKKRIEEYRNLPEEKKKKIPLLYYVLGTGTPPYKTSKEDSNYTDNSEYDEKCANCEFLYYKPAAKKFICSQIRGGIKPEGWCSLWKEIKDRNNE